MVLRSLYSVLRRVYNRFCDQKRDRYIDDLVLKGLKLGKNVDIIDTFFFDPSHCFLISIGDNCTICPNVRLIAHDASTKKKLGYTKIGRIDIGTDCFIGDSVMVLPNVTIGANTVIGAGSVVTKDIPPGSVAAGNPARVLMTVDTYMRKIKNISDRKKIFSHDYNIEHLNNVKRHEIIDFIGDSIGFIE
jgi:maltose O-acetyltransferase